MKPVPTPNSLALVELSAEALLRAPDGHHPELHDAIADMYAERLSGIILRNALPHDVIARGIARLAGPESPLPRTEIPPIAASSFGQLLVNTPDDFEGYLRAADGLQAGLDRAFGCDLIAHHEAIFRALSGGRAVSVPARDGVPYAALTVRIFDKGSHMPPHCGNDSHGWPAMQHLAGCIDTTDQLSFYTLLQAPDEGGEFVLYDHKHPPPGQRDPEAPVIDMDGGGIPEEVLARGVLDTDLRVGDMLLFDGGRIFHQALPVTGDVARWTLGGFLGLRADHGAVYYWS